MPQPTTLLSGLNIPPIAQTVANPVPAVQIHHPSPQNGTLAVPAAFANMPALPNADELPTGGSGTVYGFYNTPNAGQFAAAMAVGAADGDAVIKVDGKLIACKPLKFFLCMASAFRTKSDNSGNIIAASLDVMRKTNETPDEHYVTLILVDVPGRGLIPCKFDFKTTKADAARQAITALHECVTPQWGDKSVAHKITMPFNPPWGRVMNEVTTSRYVGRSGNPPCYITNKGSARPATPEEMKALVEFASNQENLDLFSTVQSEYEARCNEIRRKVK